MDEMIPPGSGRYHARKFQTVCYSLAPNFGKTAGFLKSPTLAGGYGGAKGFSEIGRRGTISPGDIINLEFPISLVPLMSMDHMEVVAPGHFIVLVLRIPRTDKTGRHL